MEIDQNRAFSEKLKEQVTGSFDRIRKALDLREKLLLRQLSVVVQQSQHVTFHFDNIKFMDTGEEDLVAKIRTYGKYNINNFNIILKDPYENEDYIQPVEDHDLMHKSCRRLGVDEEENPESEEIVVEFFNNKSLIKDQAEMVRESIISMALNESRELIDRNLGRIESVGVDEEFERMKIDLTNIRNRGKLTGDSLSVQGEGNDAAVDISNNNAIHLVDNIDGIDSTKGTKQQQTKTKASQTDLDTAGRSVSSDSKSSLVPKINRGPETSLRNIASLTMNNCSGTINLKNVTNLTINACQEQTNPPQNPIELHPSTARCPSEEGSPECGFYKRLITENKILRQHILKTTLANATSTELFPQIDSSASSTRSSSSNNQDQESSLSVASHSKSIDTSELSNQSENPPDKLALAADELRTVLNLPKSDKAFQHILGDLFLLGSTNDQSTASNNAKAPPSVVGATSSGSNQQQQEHTMQIQQWLKQIISETETEPLQNAELMEISRINN
ncbi:uncharacterized protein LOC129751813 [Uranotaenia lowii]|uniref:uncharacterized protein LOC129751813 n=1 Tax=Uranotaenia lowii TaxID=190385 RepID=UPI002479B11D|nr:uncharacterized protein LOC129751813 [Uranotaenia lowii]